MSLNCFRFIGCCFLLLLHFQFVRVHCIWCRSGARWNNLFPFYFFLLATTFDGDTENAKLTETTETESLNWLHWLVWGLRVCLADGIVAVVYCDHTSDFFGTNVAPHTSILDVRHTPTHIVESKPEWNSKKNVYFIHHYFFFFNSRFSVGTRRIKKNKNK